MAQAARRLAMPDVQVRQTEKQARVWADGLVELHHRISPRFGRIEPRRRALGYLGYLQGCWARPSARTAGGWRNRPVS
jgi:hypothetical protein